MNMKLTPSLSLISVVLAAALVGCGKKEEAAPAPAAAPASAPVAAAPAPAVPEPAIIFDMGGKFDKSFNQAAYDGMELWKKETGKTYLEFEIANESQRE